MPHPDDLVLSVPAGMSYDSILKHNIYSCPDTSAYSYRDVGLLTPRLASGGMEWIYPIKSIVKANPETLAETDRMDPITKRAIAAYIHDARGASVLDYQGPYRFYLLDRDHRVDLRGRTPITLFEPLGVVYFTYRDLTEGPHQVRPVQFRA
jgi:hypothetical protein